MAKKTRKVKFRMGDDVIIVNPHATQRGRISEFGHTFIVIGHNINGTVTLGIREAASDPYKVVSMISEHESNLVPVTKTTKLLYEHGYDYAKKGLIAAIRRFLGHIKG